jgi:hypothetical protein
VVADLDVVHIPRILHVSLTHGMQRSSQQNSSQQMPHLNASYRTCKMTRI